MDARDEAGPDGAGADGGGPRRPRVLVLGAALRAESLNVRLAGRAADVLERRGARVDVAQMTEFDAPSYDGDVERESGMPPGPAELCRRLGEVDAFVIASPEYNFSMPGVLKNLIDWTSRHRPQPFNQLQGLLLSASPSMAGGNRGLWSLRVPLEHLGARVYPDMFSLAQAHDTLDDEGRITIPALAERFERLLSEWLDLVEATTNYPCARAHWVEFLGEPAAAGIDREE